MTTDELEAIRARDTADYPAAEVLRKLAGVAENGDPDPMQATIDMIADRHALLAEVDRLRFEWQVQISKVIGLELTVDELRSEINRLREWQRDALPELRYMVNNVCGSVHWKDKMRKLIEEAHHE